MFEKQSGKTWGGRIMFLSHGLLFLAGCVSMHAVHTRFGATTASSGVQQTAYSGAKALRALQAVPSTDPTCCACITHEYASPAKGSLDFRTSQSTDLIISDSQQLVTLVEITKDGDLKPMARSYGGYDWEPSAGDGATLQFTCNRKDNKCSVHLPQLATGSKYQLSVFGDPAYSVADKAARFLEQVTFGPTMKEVVALGSGSNQLGKKTAEYVKAQQTTFPLTSHREMYRRHLNARHTVATSVGSVTHPCETGTRYRKAAFSQKDSNRYLTIKTEPNGKRSLSVDGFVRTIVDGPIRTPKWQKGGMDIEDGVYRIAETYPHNGLGGRFRIQHTRTFTADVEFNGVSGNPPIRFTDGILPNVLISIQGKEITPIDGENYPNNPEQEFIITKPLADPTCGFLKDPGNPEYPVFSFHEGEYIIHDPRFEVYNNTVEAPLSDGGGDVALSTFNKRGKDYSFACANVARTFLNEETCVLSNSDTACAAGTGYLGATDTPYLGIELTHAVIRALYQVSGAGSGSTLYWYTMTGLRIEDDFSVPRPCLNGATSRWIRSECDVAATPISTGTAKIFSDLINTKSLKQANPNIRDVGYDVRNGFRCDVADSGNAGFLVKDTEGICWLNVHPDEQKVLDMTFWTRNHDGNSANRNPIKEFAEAGKSTFIFPGWHEMSQWQNKKHHFREIGRLGDMINYFDIPGVWRTPTFDQLVKVDTSVAAVESDKNNVTPADSKSTLVCGSPFEVANVPRLGGSGTQGAFDAFTRTFDDNTSRFTYRHQKRQIWTEIALGAADQLRQRVAWALSQILVVSPGPTGVGSSRTEVFTAFYDIFVRNAFGNYKDILKEVSYSPLMALMLSYLGSQSTAHSWEKTGNLAYADENYAREIMQLFSTGLNRLEPNGNPLRSKDGEPILVYTNDDITEYARVWTGFNFQSQRGNVEYTGSNRLDPMQIEAVWRDRFPKMGLNRKYIGDGKPLCADLPEKHFLMEGATYNLLGRTSTPLLLREPASWGTDAKTERMILAAGGSNSLYAKLCGSRGPPCTFPSKVVLKRAVPCTGEECNVDTVRVVEVEGIYYEFSRPPCVYQAFYERAKVVGRRRYTSQLTCADPRTAVATAACCGEARENFKWSEKYWGERTTFAAANARCNNDLCTHTLRPSCNDQNQKVEAFCLDNDRFWTNSSCTVKAKIDSVGNVAIVHSADGLADSLMQTHVQEDTKTFFRVDWTDTSALNTLLADCTAFSNSCAITSDGYCLCDVSVSEEQVFHDGDILTPEVVLDSLPIGSFDPYLSKSWFQSSYSNGVRVYSNVRGKLSASSVLQATDNAGVSHRRKNVLSTVQIAGASLSFRNPVHFMSIEDEEARDAHYETDAALDQYFYHPNTAPFLAVRFAQRFGISNPSPRYIEAIARAFRTGTYNDSGTSFGSGKYGDMGAMVACVLLDREARHTLLDSDPSHGSMKEPLLKIIGLMRSMEFQSKASTGFVQLSSALDDSIGQQILEIPTVFSYFLPEHKPSGPLAQASLVAPEFLVATGPSILNLLNGLMTLVRYGLSPCYGGLGGLGSTNNCWELWAGNYKENQGILSYKPSVTSASGLVDDLATLLTAGRLSKDSRLILQQVFSGESKSWLGLIKVQQLMVTAPEFHTTGLVSKSGQNRPIPLSPPPSKKPYKAVVYLMLQGGVDSYNMLVPHTCDPLSAGSDQTLVDQYYSERTTLALQKSERTRIIDATGQPCTQFAVHPELEIVEKLYKAGNLAFFANTGVLDKPVTKKNYTKFTKTSLFAHNWMMEAARKIDPFGGKPGTGILGRMCDVLTLKGFNAKPIAIDKSTSATEGVPGRAIRRLFVPSNGVLSFNPKPKEDTFDPVPRIGELNNATNIQSSLYGETWSSRLNQALYDNKAIKQALATVTFKQHFTSTKYSSQFKAAAGAILSKDDRGTDRDVVYIESADWDHHANMKTSLDRNFKDLDTSLTHFVNEMKAQGYWNDVTLVLVSDFGRTLTANSGGGSDHGWGGNYFVLGGDVKGGQVLGKYPEDISTEGPYNIGRGRLMPTTAWESVWNSVAQWMGLEGEADLNYCLPNRLQTGAKMYTKSDVFN